MNPAMQIVKNLGPMRLGMMAAVGAGLIAFFAVLVTQIAKPGMSLLYADLETRDSSQIVAQLEASGVPYQTSGDGSTIRVPGDQVGSMRLRLAAEGLPNGGSMGYELFDRSEGLGSTTQVQRLNELRALEGELARTITSLKPVRAARVHLVLPRRETFSRTRQTPSASVTLRLQGGGLDKSQTRAIQQLVAAAVPGLDARRIAVVDDHGRLLARTDDGSSASSIESADDARIQAQSRVRRRVEELVERIVGHGRVRAEVSMEMNFDRLTENTESYDPEGQVVRSSNSIQEAANSQGAGEEAVTVAGNVPDDAGLGGPVGGESSNSSRTEETTNFEISRTVRNFVREGPQVERMSIAVLVDGTYSGDEDNLEYAPRTEEEMQQIERLVRTAAGFDEARGDTIDVVNMPFAQPELDPELEEESLMERFLQPSPSMVRLMETMAWAVAAVLIFLLVVRPLMGQLFDPGRVVESSEFAESNAMLPQVPGVEQPQLPSPQGGEDDPDSMINLETVDGRVKASSVRKIGEIVEKHPEEAVAILRNWIYQEG